MGERQIDEEARDALVEDGPVVPAGLMTQSTSKPTFADAGRSSDILPGVRDLRSGSAIPSTRAVAKPSQCSVRSAMLALNTWSSGNPIGH